MCPTERLDSAVNLAGLTPSCSFTPKGRRLTQCWPGQRRTKRSGSAPSKRHWTTCSPARGKTPLTTPSCPLSKLPFHVIIAKSFSRACFTKATFARPATKPCIKNASHCWQNVEHLEHRRSHLLFHQDLLQFCQLLWEIGSALALWTSPSTMDFTDKAASLPLLDPCRHPSLCHLTPTA